MDQSKFIELQKSVRDNQTELQEYMRGMNDWIDSSSIDNSKQGEEKIETLPPVRNSLYKKRKKNATQKNPQLPIPAYDYRAWDKFDVDKYLEESDDDADRAADELATDDEAEEDRRKLLADDLRKQGNQLIKEKRYEEALECYTKCIDVDPINSIVFTNRAFVHLKLEHFEKCLTDCSTALQYDKASEKALYRRSLAYAKLNRLDEAKDDLEELLKIHPRNASAKMELSKVEIVLNSKGIVQPIRKEPQTRSVIPLRPINIIDVGGKDLLNVEQLNVTGSTLQTKEEPTAAVKVKEVEIIETTEVTPPLNSFEFLTTLRQRCKPNCNSVFLAKYMIQIEPVTIERLFGDHMEWHMFMAICKSFVLWIKDETDQDIINRIVSLLYHMSKLRRFSFICMFSSKDDKVFLREFIEKLRGNSISADVIDKLNIAFLL